MSSGKLLKQVVTETTMGIGKEIHTKKKTKKTSPSFSILYTLQHTLPHPLSLILVNKKKVHVKINKTVIFLSDLFVYINNLCIYAQLNGLTLDFVANINKQYNLIRLCRTFITYNVFFIRYACSVA